MALLSVKGLEAGYGRLPVLHGVSLDVEPGEFVGIVGPNGSGKSTLVKAMFRMLPWLAGSVAFEGEALDGQRAERLSGLGMAVVPQVGSVFPELTIEDNLRIGGMGTGSSPREICRRAYEAFPPLEAKARARAHTLSGGERQMLAVGSALASHPKFLALDEPTNGLAPKTARELIAYVDSVREEGATVLWVVGEHAADVLERLDRVHLLQEGLVKGEWSRAELAERDDLMEVIFGSRVADGSEAER
jgi:branched-chain amino acid transport system ATP-binding protein